MDDEVCCFTKIEQSKSVEDKIKEQEELKEKMKSDWYCPDCKKIYKYSYRENHLLTKRHIKNHLDNLDNPKPNWTLVLKIDDFNTDVYYEYN